MLKIVILFLSLFCGYYSNAQDAASLYETGRKFLLQGDYDNAILVLKRANSMAPNNLQYAKELTNAYYYKGDMDNAKNSVNSLLELDEADEAVYYTASNIYRSKEELKEAEKILRKGLKKYNNSGLLYDALGQILGGKNDASAIIQWENGIEKDPNYAGNYYQAARYYYYTSHTMAKIWSIYYGEMFVNMESYTTKTVEIKTIILDSYKKIFTAEEFGKKQSKNEFENAFVALIQKLKDEVSSGVTTTNLIKFRTQFILHWFHTKTAFPSALLERHQQLLKEGFFEDYNYWLFEPIQNVASFENWIKLHEANFEAFSKYHKNRVLKVSNNEYYKIKN